MYQVLSLLSVLFMALADDLPAFISTGLEATSSRPYIFYVTSDLNNYATARGGVSFPAVAANNPGWTASIPGSVWIWSQDASSSDVMFSNWFYVYGTPVSAMLYVAADDNVMSFINGVTVNCNKNTAYVPQGQGTCDVTTFVNSGVNDIQFLVTNLGGPAGLLYRLAVTVRI
jgi:hypothetical protein